MSISQIFPIVGAPASGLTKPWLPAQVNSLLIDTTLQIPTGATAGYVLTSDASGHATWSPAPGGGASSTDTKVTTNLSGAITVTGYIFHITQITVGSVTHVTLHLPANDQPSSASPSINFSVGIPVGLVPTVSSFCGFIMNVDNGNSIQTGTLNIEPSGSMFIELQDGISNFSATGSSGFAGDAFFSWDLSSNV